MIDSHKSYHDTPEPLKLLCLNELLRKPLNLCRYMLPSELGDLLAVGFRNYCLTNRVSSYECINFFEHFKHKYIPLNRINFSGLPITGSFFIEFFEEYKHQLEEIDISSCKNFSNIDLIKFNEYLRTKTSTTGSNNTENHKTLIIGDTLKEIIDRGDKLFDDNVKLKKLVLFNVSCDSNELIMDSSEIRINRKLKRILTPSISSSLKYLDLSYCSIGKGTPFCKLESLEFLILFESRVVYPDIINTICHLKKLRVLDISKQYIEDPGETPEDIKLLDLLVENLPNLTRLDISGTNLVSGKDRHISAFEARVEKPFEFLGLFHTGNDAAYRGCIPALTVAGEANETQMLNACEAYMDRPGQLAKALNDLYNFYKTITPSETFENINRALDVVLPILTKHITDEQVIIFTTAALWCIVKINVTSKNLNDAKVRRTITSRLLDVMHHHKDSRVILINGGLTLLFLPDIICEHSRVASISLKMCQDPDPRTQGFGTTLLNTLACQVGGDQKIYIGKLQAIETMIRIIHDKIALSMCDEILETAWSTLWNITDETPDNCKRFLEYNGLEAFENCMDRFGDNKEVLRNIMGLLGNVAECQNLRVHFMKGKYIKRFRSLLFSRIDGIECSYNACGILANLCSDGQEFWDKYKTLICRQQLMSQMCIAIDKWPINSRRNINYRSFEPIVKLLDVNVAAAAQYWAVFALTNLTRINPTKYCPMLLPYGGLDKLRKLAEIGITEPYVMNLAQIAIYQYERFENEGTLAGLEMSDSVDLDEVKNFRAESVNVDGTSEMGEFIF